jgi:hypothetical protein
MTYITIGDEAYPTNTSDEIAAAQSALAAAGLESAPVYAGEPDGLGDSYSSGQILWAAEDTGPCLQIRNR